MMRPACLAAALTTLSLLSGCVSGFTEKARNGITFYCPGAGNVDFGDVGIREGLEAAGYTGQVATVTWTVSVNPAIDQAVRVNARLGAASLADAICQYKRKFPDKPVNLIGLSAGTGVAIWALENVPPDVKVDNVILLGSSLSSTYDVSEALKRVKGKIYNYYSSSDAVLAIPMKVFGTIDGAFGEDGAGAVGLRSPRGRDRIVNIPWRSEFSRYGYNGGHTDSTSSPFVRAVLSKHVISGSDDGTGRKVAATQPAQRSPAGRPVRATPQ